MVSKHACDFWLYKIHSAEHVCNWKLSIVSCFILYYINLILVFVTGISSLCFKVAHSTCTGGGQIFREFKSSAQTRHSSGFCH